MNLKHSRVTGLSGNEIYCLSKLGYQAGPLCLGNSVLSLGIFGSVISGVKNLVGGEVGEITSLIEDGRRNALQRMELEATSQGGLGITGVTTELIVQQGNVEFLTLGSIVRGDKSAAKELFSTSADAQELFCQLDAGFTPLRYVFGNVAYSIGIGGGIGGLISGLARGEVAQYSDIFDRTRHIALNRITEDAKRCGANAVVGIETTISSLFRVQEMVMIGTASHHPALGSLPTGPVTSDMTNQEMWNMVQLGFMPLRLVMGVSVYSLGIGGAITSAVRSFARGEINELTTLLYEAREKALERIERDAQKCGADEVVGVTTHVYNLGGGLVEFLAIGTAVKKISGLSTRSAQLPPQAIIQDRDTFFESEQSSVELSSQSFASAKKTQGGPLGMLFVGMLVMFYVLKMLWH